VRDDSLNDGFDKSRTSRHVEDFDWRDEPGFIVTHRQARAFVAEIDAKVAHLT
jgi:hypothetical protein